MAIVACIMVAIALNCNIVPRYSRLLTRTHQYIYPNRSDFNEEHHEPLREREREREILYMHHAPLEKTLPGL